MTKLFSEKVLFKILVILFTFICLTTLIETVVCLRQAPGECEESWFLYLAQNRVCENFSFAPLYYNKLPNVVLKYLPCRIVSLTVVLVSSLFFALSLSYYCKNTLEIKVSKWRYLCMCLLPLFSASSQHVRQADYGTSSFVWVMLVVSFLLFSLSGASVRSLACSGLSGFFMLQAVMIRPPLGLLAMCVCGVYALYGFRRVSFYLVGAIIGFIFFILFITTPVEFMTVINSFLSSSASTTDGHGGQLLITSTMQIVIYVVPCIVFGVHLYFIEKINDKYLLIKRILQLLVLLFLFLHCFYSLGTGFNLWAARRVDVMCVFVLFFYCVAKIFPTCAYKSLSAMSILPIVPIAMGIGTTTPFGCEACGYLIFTLAFIVMSLSAKTNKAILLLALFILFFYQFLMVWHLRHRKWSNHQRLIDSTEQVMDTNLLATPDFCDYLRRVDLETQGRPFVLGGPTQWAIIELLHKVPLSNSFRLNSAAIVSEIINKKPQKDQFFILKDQYVHFTDSDITNICNAISASRSSKIQLNQDRSILIFK